MLSSPYEKTITKKVAGGWRFCALEYHYKKLGADILDNIDIRKQNNLE